MINITEILSAVSVSSQQLLSTRELLSKNLDVDQLNIYRKVEDSLTLQIKKKLILNDS